MMIRKKIIILGAGISAASVADELTSHYQYSKDNILILEKRNRVGGKLYSNKPLNTELGGVVFTANYKLTDTLAKNNIRVETLLNTEQSDINITLHGTPHPTYSDHIRFGTRFTWQMMVFAKEYFFSQWYQSNTQPTDYDLSFKSFAEKKQLTDIVNFLHIMGAGMGYGDQRDEGNYAFRWLNYMGYMTIPLLTIGGKLSGRSLVRPEGGYQNVVERMLEPYDVKLCTTISSITRSADHVTVGYYDDKHNQYTVTGDLLITTMSPYYWPKMSDFALSPAEQTCVEHLTYQEYPVAICAIKHYPPQQKFVPPALTRDGFGHIAFIFTADNSTNPTNGRICQIFINLHRDTRDYSLEPHSNGREALLLDLEALGYPRDDVTILDYKVWHDYNPSIPRDTSLALEQEEDTHAYRTLHVGTFKHDSFDYVSSAEVSARNRIRTFMDGKPTLWQQVKAAPYTLQDHLKRGYTYFTLPSVPPRTDLQSSHTHNRNMNQSLD